MAVFLLRSQDGPTYVPPACTTPLFTDVPCSNPFARGITGGCGAGTYCPTSGATRGQMSVFLVRTFGLR